MKSSFCVVLAFVASSPASTVLARGNGNRRYHNRISNLHSTRDLVTGAMPPQAPEGYSERQLIDLKDGKATDPSKTTTKVIEDDKKGDLKDKKDKKDLKDMTKTSETKLDDKKKTDANLLEQKEEDALQKDPNNATLLGGENGLGGLFTGGRVDEEESIAAAQTAYVNSGGSGKSNPAKIVAPLVVVGVVAALAGY